ncbi:MAG: hypothetical protein JHC71_05510 [Blastococcus sp.]|nr:hypothetical protein [Blastococcus sp.]
MEQDDFLLARVAEDADVGRWTPDRIRAHEASMRRVVDEYRERRSAYLAIAESDRSTLEKFEKHVAWAAFGEALRLLSEPYQRHAAYQPEWSRDWRPEPPPRRP